MFTILFDYWLIGYRGNAIFNETDKRLDKSHKVKLLKTIEKKVFKKRLTHKNIQLYSNDSENL